MFTLSWRWGSLGRVAAISFLMLGVMIAQATAATYFVRSGGAGSKNGTSWANAWPELSSISWSTLAAGDVVCLAGGSYTGSISTAKSGAAGNPITIKRATAADSRCGSTSAGWTASFDSQVVTTGSIDLANDYVTIDGSVWNGIQVIVGNPVGGRSIAIESAAPTNGVVLRNIEAAGPCPNGQKCAQNGDNRAASLNHWNGSSYDLQNNMTMQYLNLHGSCTIMWIANSNNLTIEHTRFADTSDTTPGNTHCHPNVIATNDSTNTTFRFNEITTWEVEGIMICPGTTGGCKNSWYIYGNLWHDPFTGSFPRVIESQGGVNGPIFLYNNTFVNLYYICANAGNNGSWSTSNQGRNNIYYNSATPCGLASEDYDYSNKALSEAHGQGNAPNPFVNLAAQDYRLAMDTTPGLNLGAPYNIDYLGATRTTWDRGAYEFGAGAPAPPPPTGPAAPQSLTVQVR